MTWLPLIGVALALLALGWCIGRGMRHKDESISRINRSGLQDDSFGSGTGTGVP